MISNLLEILLHLDKYLLAAVRQFSTTTYALLFLVVFLETGLVVTPFLPGDSLLFAAGALAASGAFNIWALLLIVFLAAVLGDTANYHIGKYIGPKIFRKKSSFFFNKEYLARAQSFYERHGKKTIVLARFIPVIRTFAPFVAGIGKMPYIVFLAYNVIGGAIWCALFTLGGFFFGNIPWVKERFGVLVLAIIFVSFIPLVKEILPPLFKKFHSLVVRKKKKR